MPEETPQPEESAQQAEGEEVTPQETMYEGALAGLTEEEIGKLALAEEESGARRSEDGAEFRRLNIPGSGALPDACGCVRGEK